MNEIQYVGENLLPGQIGFLATILALITALYGTICYLLSIRTADISNKSKWQNTGRIFLIVHIVSVLIVVSTLFYILYFHLFEYHYAWKHSSTDLPWYYNFSSFWEGQEGSFLLWIFWNAVLSIFFIKRAKEWESGVIAVMLSIQVFLITMVLGIDLFGAHIGSSPFILLREQMQEAPIFKTPNYLSMIQGNGLNPLLQNYWMVIHPPILFLGFASTAVPFAFAISGLLRKQYDSWIRPGMSWLLFSVAILGAGILMGGAWAYEALTFGGFWAWDPVENASLVPWITLVAGLHTILAYRASGHSLRISYILILLTFILVLYSTFLTRSGILGDSSVHSFTDLGLMGQLVVYLFFYIFFCIGILAYSWKKIPLIQTEEASYSREFWLFVAALILCISAFQITFDTSREVINKVFHTQLAKPEDAIAHFNRWQIWIAIFVALLSGAVQFLKYKNSAIIEVVKKLLIPFILAFIGAVVLSYFWQIRLWQEILLLFSGLFSVIANLFYIITVLKGKIKLSGASIAHIGFALILIGALVSAGTKSVISSNNPFSIDDKGADKNNRGDNIILFKNNQVDMHGYKVTYLGDSVSAPNTYFKVKYEKVDTLADKTLETFYLYPNAQINPKMGLIASPDTRHYLSRDIYTHVTSIPDKEGDVMLNPDKLDTVKLGVGDTISMKWGHLVLENIDPQPQNILYTAMPGDIAFEAQLAVLSKERKNNFIAKPIYYIRKNTPASLVGSISELGLHFDIVEVLPEEKKVRIAIRKTEPDYITLKAIVFPYINLLWLGCVVMFVGTLMSMYQRIEKRKKLSN